MIVIISPKAIMILMICETGIPSALESSLTETPETTVTTPVGATISRGCLGGAAARSRAAWRWSRGRWPTPSITTRRLRRDPGAP